MKRTIIALLICLLIACSKHHSNPPVVVGGVTVTTDCGGAFASGQFVFKDASFWVDSGYTNGQNTITGLAGIDFIGDTTFDAGYIQTVEAAYYSYFDSTVKVTSGIWAGMPKCHYDGKQTIQFGNGTPYTISGYSVCNVGVTYILTNATQRVVLFEMSPQESAIRRAQIQARMNRAAPAN